MMRTSPSWYFKWIVLLSFGLSSCKSSQINAPAPPLSYSAMPSLRVPSTISLPVKVDLASLQSKVNDALPSTLYYDDNIDDDNLSFKVQRLGALSLTNSGSALQMSIPVRVNALGKVRLKACPICPDLSQTGAMAAELKLTSTTSLGISSDWKLNPYTTFTYQWISSPFENLGLLQKPLTAIMDRALSSQMPKISAMVDKLVRDKIDIRTPIQKGYSSLIQPIQIDPKTNSWLAVEPQSISSSPITVNKENISFTLGLGAFVKTVTGSKPGIASATLPAFSQGTISPGNFNVAILAIVPYDLISQMANTYLANQTFTSPDGKYSAVLSNLRLFASGNHLVTEVDVVAKRGSKKPMSGKLYLESLPYYDAATSSMKLGAVQYHIDSKNALLKSAAWISNLYLENLLQKKVSVPVGALLDPAKGAINTWLGGGKALAPNLYLNGSLVSITPGEIAMTQEGIAIVVNGVGSASLEIK